MKHKSYKSRGYKEINSSETPYMNIFTGQRIFIDENVVPPKKLFYVEDLNPYQRRISIVMDARQRRILEHEKAQCATNIFGMMKLCMDRANSQQSFDNPGYQYPLWFKDLLEIMYFGNYP